METKTGLNFFFIVNPGSGTDTPDWQEIITNYFKDSIHRVEIHKLQGDFNNQSIREKIASSTPDRVIAVGGDGTVKLLATCLMDTKIPLGILPAGSANGLAKELTIPEDYSKALDVAVNGVIKKIHLIKINEQVCIHLSDIGLNAHAVMKFETLPGRGMWGYLRASLNVMRRNQVMKVTIAMRNQTIIRKAHMIVIANATRYGSGAVINPVGRLDDNLFEVVVIKKISLGELFKMIFSHRPFDSTKTEIFQTDTLLLQSFKNVHFQIDGEYLGKTQEVRAAILPNALEIIVPRPE